MSDNASASLMKSLLLMPVVAFRSLIESLQKLSWFCRSRRFLRIGLCYYAQYLWLDPYIACRRYLERWDADEVQPVYGETPFATLEDIATRVELKETDVLYELGCGRGLTVFWFNHFYGCRSVGIELVPHFVKRGNRIVERLNIDRVTFREENILEADLSEATVVYFFGTAFSDLAVARIVERFETQLKPGTRIASVSFPLQDFADRPHAYTLKETFTAQFLWGEGTIYIQEKNA
ncbi:SAM-dependent methyltransferase [Pokkaliibacter sp. CJK22405]|uniref:SAM-dependent methyltransferase n=1 Tax=Pokkaliibacter sp. CJK22405 TaxID=3384615 RepID=UPI00398511A2